MNVGGVNKDTIERMRTLWNGMNAEERKALTDLICICHTHYVRNRLNEMEEVRRYDKGGT